MLSRHACFHQGVLTENLNTKQFAERGSDGMGGTGCQMKSESEMWVRKDRDRKHEDTSIKH